MLPELSVDEEQFALAYFANGGRGADAYLQVNPSVTRESARVQAWRLLRKATIQDAIGRLREELRSRVKSDTEALAQRLLGMTQGNITDVLDWGGTVRAQVKDADQLSPDEAALIEEFTEEPTQWGTKRKVKLVNRIAAARLLLELRGELVKQVKHDGEVVHRVVAMPDNLSRDEWAERYAPGKQVQARVESIEVNDGRE